MTDRRHKHDSSREFDDLAQRLRHANQTVQPSPDLIKHIRHRLQVADHREHSQRRVRIWRQPAMVIGSLAAMLTLLAVGWASLQFTTSGSKSKSASTQSPTPVAANDQASVPNTTRVTFAPDSAVFGRTIRTTSDNISIVLLYRDVPVLKTPTTPQPKRPNVQGTDT